MEPIPYTRFPNGALRPLAHTRVENPEDVTKRTGLLPMLMDTGSDICIFNQELAAELGIDLTGAQTQEVAVAGGGSATMNAWLVRIVLPQFGHHFPLSARFGEFKEGLNGLIGRNGCLRWMHTCFAFNESFLATEFRSRDGKWGAIPTGPRPVP